ncbi:Chitinase 2 [Chamberlinius hualienensis]
MKFNMAFKVILLIITALVCNANADPAVFCFWGSWSVYRYGLGTFTADMIPASLCTHLVYAFAGLDPRTYKIKSLDPWCDLSSAEGGGLNNYDNAVSAKLRNPSLKVMLSVGGWNEGSVQYSQMVSTAYTRKTFINSVVLWLIRYGFDGLDMNWEYPAQRGGVPSDKDNFSLLLKELKEAFEPHGFVLSATLSGLKSVADVSYDVSQISEYADYMNVMSYEYHSYYDEPRVLHQSPMNSRPDENPTLNVNFTMHYFLYRGAAPNKLLMGIVSDGRTYTLADPLFHNIGDPAVGPGQSGQYSQSPGYLATYEICANLKLGWKMEFDEVAQAPYCYGGYQWAAYDDDRSVGAKVQLIKDLGLGGVMFWSIDMDDCRRICDSSKQCYLLGSINNYLIGAK